jgi:hypothetical protein
MTEENNYIFLKKSFYNIYDNTLYIIKINEIF